MTDTPDVIDARKYAQVSAIHAYQSATMNRQMGTALAAKADVADVPAVDEPHTWTAAQRGAPVTLVSTEGHITLDAAAANNFVHVLTEDTMLDTPTNPAAGQSGHIVFIQNASTPMALAFGPGWKFPGGQVPTLTAVAGAVDVLAYAILDPTAILATLIKDVK